MAPIIQQLLCKDRSPTETRRPMGPATSLRLARRARRRRRPSPPPPQSAPACAVGAVACRRAWPPARRRPPAPRPAVSPKFSVAGRSAVVASTPSSHLVSSAEAASVASFFLDCASADAVDVGVDLVQLVSSGVVSEWGLPVGHLLAGVGGGRAAQPQRQAPSCDKQRHHCRGRGCELASLRAGCRRGPQDRGRWTCGCGVCAGSLPVSRKPLPFACVCRASFEGDQLPLVAYFSDVHRK